MKIIRKRAGPDWWVGKQAKCDKCYTIVELVSGDNVKEHHTSPALLSVYFRCPECGNELRVYYE